MPREQIQYLINWLVSQHMILMTKGRYPVFHLTYDGLHYSEVITPGKLNKLKKYIERDRIETIGEEKLE